MNFGILPVIITFLGKVAGSYGQFFMLISRLTEDGFTVFKSVEETLSKTKYAHVKARFQKAVLLAISAYTEFRYAFSELKTEVNNNPGDFITLNSFVSKLKKDLPKDIESIVEGPGEFLKSASENDDLLTVPKFVLDSYEYTYAANFGKKVLNTSEFTEVFVKRYQDDPEAMERALKRVQRDFRTKGYTTLLKPLKTGETSGQYIYWSDDTFHVGVPEKSADVFEFKAPNSNWPFTNEKEKKDANKTGE